MTGHYSKLAQSNLNEVDWSATFSQAVLTAVTLDLKRMVKLFHGTGFSNKSPVMTWGEICLVVERVVKKDS